MDIRYDIHTLNNAEGAGKERKYVVLQQREPMTEEEMEKQIEENCSLTSSDVKAVFSEIKGMAPCCLLFCSMLQFSNTWGSRSLLIHR